MNIEYLKNYFEMTDNPKFYLIDVFSWAGVCEEVAFSPSTEGTTEESIRLIDRALTETFHGYDNEEHTYDLYTEVHFEDDAGEYYDSAGTLSYIQANINNFINMKMIG